jgi:quinol monooxygenase YgiN
MSTSIITTDDSVVTVITSFTVEPGRQHELAEIISTATEEWVQHQTGFISSNIHISGDGTQVVNYSQWANITDLHTMLADATSEHRMDDARAIASPTSERYVVHAVYRRPRPAAATTASA